MSFGGENIEALQKAAAGLGDEHVDPAVRTAVAEADAVHCKLARADGGAFTSYVLRDEETGGSVALSRCHAEWHRKADEHDRLLIWSHVEAGKTQQMSIGRTLYALGRDPSTRAVIVSNTDGQAQKICMAIGKYIEQSAELKRVFPNLQRAKGYPWNAHALFVKRPTAAKDPSVTTCGVHGNILGARIDLLILDDVLDYENVTSPTQREDLFKWYQSTLEGRLTRRAQVICVGTAWHRDDIMHRFARTPSWKAFRYPVLDRSGNPTWPERFPHARVERRRQDLIPLEFSRQMMCRARSDEESRFKQDWIDACMDRGERRPMRHAIQGILPPGMRTFTGVDLGLGHATSDLTVFFTILCYPNGDREVLDVESGKWKGPEILNKLVDVSNRYGSEVIVENNAAQDFILQFARDLTAVNVRPYTTGARTHRSAGEYSIEAMATEMYNQKWIIPSQGRRASAEVEAWVQEMLYYDPKGHPGDRLMASFFAREGARQDMGAGKKVVEFGRM